MTFFKSSPLKTIIPKITLISIALVLLLLALEFVWFFHVLRKGPVNDAADVIVVFAGGHARIEKGYALANQGLAAHLIVSPASESRMKVLDKSHRLKRQYLYIIEDRAETTFQNAALVADLIKKHGLQTVLLVTSDYHMPRSCFLLRLQLLGHGVSVMPCLVEVGRFGRNPMAWSVLQKKIVYNEMVELWGSLAEMVHYSVTGRLPEGGLQGNRGVATLRSILLFDIHS